mmetsp:Transcript_16617/g.63174  ORF Transcript_16617/g.63174 Transcript_16617/m.63174 type:complete len:205 (-) Transcript_16617:277-891(-)
MLTIQRCKLRFRGRISSSIAFAVPSSIGRTTSRTFFIQRCKVSTRRKNVMARFISSLIRSFSAFASLTEAEMTEPVLLKFLQWLHTNEVTSSSSPTPTQCPWNHSEQTSQDSKKPSSSFVYEYCVRHSQNFGVFSFTCSRHHATSCFSAPSSLPLVMRNPTADSLPSGRGTRSSHCGSAHSSVPSVPRFRPKAVSLRSSRRSSR